MKQVLSVIGLFVILISASAAMAEMTFVWWGAPAEVRIRVGEEIGTPTVTHEVPLANIGDGTPITGAPQSILIEASARRSSFFESLTTNFIVTVDSSRPLTNGSYSIPFTDISWTSQDGDIPSGRFDGTPSQIILPATRAILQISDRHTFIYDNTRSVPAGTYTGTVTYTVSIP